MSPPASNLYMVFNGRLSAPKSIVKESASDSTYSISHGIHNTIPLIHSLPDGKLQPSVEEGNFIQKPLILSNIPLLNHNMVRDYFNGMSHQKAPLISSSVVPNNIESIVTPKVTPQILPEVTLNVAGNAYDIIPTTIANSKDDVEHLKLVEKAISSARDLSEVEASPSKPEKPTSLILKPMAKAVAGAKGIAIASPMSRAVVRKGQQVKIHFDPQAVAVVGPGGVADAHSDLLISYFEDLPSQQTEKP